MRTRIFLLAALLAVAVAATAHGAVRASSSPQTTVPDVFVTIHVSISDTRIKLDRPFASRGDEARFVMHNSGTKPHTFTLGTQTGRGAGNQTGFSTTLKPKQEKLILLFLDYRGPLPYRSILKYDLRKPGMRGTFTIR